VMLDEIFAIGSASARDQSAPFASHSLRLITATTCARCTSAPQKATSH